MKKLIQVALSLAVVGFSAATASSLIAPRTFRQGTTLHRYFIATPMRSPLDARATIGWLRHNEFDVAGYDWQRGTIEVITDAQGIEKLNAHGLAGTTRERFTPGMRAPSIDNRYYTPAKIEAALKALNAQYPQLTRLQQIGTSIQGRAIWAMLISSTPNPNDPGFLEKPSILFDGMHHAREIMTPEIVMDVAQTLLSSARLRSAAAIRTLSNWNVWIVPMLNVDGNSLVWSSDPWWRKNAQADGGSSAYGVDINRNYAYGWNSCGGSSGSRWSDDYRGAAAGSEPETKALMGLAAATRPVASLSYHSYSELVLYPYGCDGHLTGDNALHEKISRELAALLPKDSGRGNYTPGTPWQILYSTDGDSMSDVHAKYGTLAYTFEVNTSFQPSYEMRDPTVLKHRKAWQYFLDRIDRNLLTLKVNDGRTGRPAIASVDVTTIARRYGESPFMTNEAGNFFKVLDPGRYMIRVSTPDGRRTEVTVDMNGSQTIPITL